MRTLSNEKKPVRPDVPHHIKESLTEIIDYLWADELKHVREMASNHSEIHLGEHIFAHLVRVRAWLDGWSSKRCLTAAGVGPAAFMDEKDNGK